MSAFFVAQFKVTMTFDVADIEVTAFSITGYHFFLFLGLSFIYYTSFLS